MSESANVTPQAVECPACGSEHSADGRTLLKRSPRLVDLEFAEKTIGKLEKAVDKLEAELTASKAKLTAAEKAVALPKKAKPVAAAPAATAPATPVATEGGKRGFFGRSKPE